MNNYIILIILLFIIIFNNIFYVCFFNSRQEGFSFKKIKKALMKPIKPILDFLKNTGAIVENFIVDLLVGMFGDPPKDKFSKYIADRVETTRGSGTWGFAALGMLIAATLFAFFILYLFFYCLINAFLYILLNAPFMIINVIFYIFKSLIATPVISGIKIVKGDPLNSPSMKDSDISKGMTSLESIKQSGLL